MDEDGLLDFSFGLLCQFTVLGLFTKPAYSDCNASRAFRFTEEAGADLLDCERAYGYFLCGHPELDKGDSRLFRTFTVEPWKFWQWRQLLLHGERYGLPYISN